MSILVKKIALAEQKPNFDGPLIHDKPLNVLESYEVPCLVRLGTLSMTIAQINQLREGSCLPLEQKTDEPVDILLNNQVIARAELLCLDENFAIKIIEVCIK